MAEVNSGEGGGRVQHQKKRAKKLSTRIDMTPMVDLGFLLLTFFMLTTTFSQPKVTELTPPIKTKDSTKIIDSLALTLVLSKDNRIYYYNGKLNTNPDSNNIELTDFSDNGLRKIVLKRNHVVLGNLKPLEEKHDNHLLADTTFARLKEQEEENKQALFVIVKTDSLAKYVNVISALDEMNISNVGKYALIPCSKMDRDMIDDYNKKHNLK
jgi:biopolymer transport protein ExbD